MYSVGFLLFSSACHVEGNDCDEDDSIHRRLHVLVDNILVSASAVPKAETRPPHLSTGPPPSPSENSLARQMGYGVVDQSASASESPARRRVLKTDELYSLLQISQLHH